MLNKQLGFKNCFNNGRWGKKPQGDKTYEWTLHVQEKMRFYNLSESRVRRVLHSPKRTEWGIAPNTVAMMQPSASSKTPYEIWIMFQEINQAGKKKRRIITAWRYPGKSPVRDPIPEDILREIKKFTFPAACLPVGRVDRPVK